MRAAAFVALAAFAVSACNPATPYAAIVNGTRISQAQVTRELEGLAANRLFSDPYDQSQAQQRRPGIVSSGTAHRAFTQAFVATVLGLDIQSALVHAEVVRRHIEPSAAAIDDPATATAAGQQFGNTPDGKPIFPGFSRWLRHLFQQRQAELDALGKVLPPAPVVDAAAIKKFYDDNPQDFITNLCVAHIQLTSKADADAVVSQLAQGADFATVARQSSTDTATASKGGDLGCASPQAPSTNPVQQDAAFVIAASKAPLGQVTGPIQLQNGWDVLKVSSRDEQSLTDVVKGEIEQHLQQGTTTPISQFLNQALPTLHVQVNPQYGRWDQQQVSVVPAPVPDPVRSGLLTPPTSQAPLSGAGGSPAPVGP